MLQIELKHKVELKGTRDSYEEELLYGYRLRFKQIPALKKRHNKCCIDCGFHYISFSKDSLRCDTCKPKHEVKQKREQHRAKTGCKPQPERMGKNRQRVLQKLRYAQRFTGIAGLANVVMICDTNGEIYKFIKGKKIPIAESKSPQRETRKSRKRASSDGTVTREAVKSLLKEQQGKCKYCERDIRQSFHKDHIVPLAKGGVHAMHNIQLLCPSCNIKKSDSVPKEANLLMFCL